MRSLSWVAAVIVGSVLAGIGAVWIVSLAGCAANAPHLQNEIESTQAGGDYAACTFKVKADGGTFRDWQVCACDVDRSHHVDSGACP